MKAHCGEALFRFALIAQATLTPLYGALELTAEQVRGAYSVCSMALPSLSAQDARKLPADEVFGFKNIAAIEALCVLCAGSGEGVSGVWRLVEATLEVIEEYIPGKDTENNYVRAE